MLELYHKNEIFKSLTVMQEEEKNLDEIILFKKKNKIDYDFFATKKAMLSSQILVCTFLYSIYLNRN